MAEKAQPKTADVRALTLIGLVIMITLTLLVLAVYGISRMLEGRATERQASPGVTEMRIPPSPRLQANPRTELKAYREASRQRLGSYGWVSRERGIAHIPIEQAMELTATGVGAGEP